MEPQTLLRKYFSDIIAYGIVETHSRLVAEEAVAVARRLGLPAESIRFIREAALLHDIGICRTNAADIGCTGDLPYLAHGIAGREILESEGLPLHALVCERHIGVGLTAAEITEAAMPLPARDMIPLSIEERLVCFADLFYSKNRDSLERRKTDDDVRRMLGRFGARKVEIFDAWLVEFAGT